MGIRGLNLDIRYVYEPREDSLLLAEAVEEMAYGEVLDIGTGSGIQAFVASRKAKRVTAVDINPEAIDVAKANAEKNGLKIDFLVSDLFQNVEGKFDLIIFNPPYLPVNDKIKNSEQWSGGETGRNVIERFASEVKNHIKEDGKILMIISSLTELEETKKIFENLGFLVKVIKEKKIPWEMLYVLKISFL